MARATAERRLRGGDPNGDGHPHATLYSFGVDVTIVHSTGSKAEGDKKTSEPEREPGAADDVAARRQEAGRHLHGPQPEDTASRCSSSPARSRRSSAKPNASPATDTCQLIEVEPGFPETFVYGEDGERYKINVRRSNSSSPVTA